MMEILSYLMTAALLLVAYAIGNLAGHTQGYNRGAKDGGAKAWAVAWQQQDYEIDHNYILRGEAVSMVAAIAGLQDPEVRRRAVKEWTEDMKQRAARRPNP